MFTHNSKLAKKEPTWGSVDKTKLPRVAFARKGTEEKSTWGFPHHWVENGSGSDKNGIYTHGTMFLHRGGLNAAWSAANGGRSGKKAEPAVLAHLRKHFQDLGIKKAELQAIDPTVDLDKLDQELTAAGLFQEAAPELEAELSRLLQEP
jgi:hypothetical protein